MTTRVYELLQQVSLWPVDNVSAAVVDAEGTWITTGDLDREYALASVTKLLAAYGFLVAIEEGVFELETPAPGALGEAGATVRHLLAHASGVGFASRTPERGVGERRIYSSAGFDILADMVAAEADMSFGRYLHEAVFEPLAMGTAWLRGSAGHGASASVRDLQAFAAELRAPRLVDPATLTEAWTVQFPSLRGLVPGYRSYNPCPWGLGFEIKGSKEPHWTGASMPENLVGHFGQSGTYLWFDPTTTAAMIVLTDRPFGPWAKPLWSDTNEAVWQALRELAA